MAHENLLPAVDSSTRAQLEGSGYVVELLEDGSFRELWAFQVDKNYRTPGILLTVPALLTEDEWDDDPEYRYYGKAQDQLCNDFDVQLEKYELDEDYAFSGALPWLGEG